MDAASTQDQTPGRKIWGLDELHHVFDGRVRVVDQMQSGVANFAQIVGWDAGGHTNRNTLAAVDQQVREFCWQYRWFFFGAVEVVVEVDGVLVNTVDKSHGQTRQPALGVAHGCRRVVW